MPKPPKVPSKLGESERAGRDLDRLATVHYVMAGLLTLSTVLIGLFFAAQLPFCQSWGVFLLTVGFAASNLFMGALMAVANVRSAKAIESRQDSHVSYYVAGLNTLAFPLGTVVGIHAWSVLNRPAVRQLYLECSGTAPGVSTGKGKLKLVLPPAPVNLEEELPHIEAAEEEMWRRMEEEHRKQTAPASEGKGEG